MTLHPRRINGCGHCCGISDLEFVSVVSLKQHDFRLWMPNNLAFKLTEIFSLTLRKKEKKGTVEITWTVRSLSIEIFERMKSLNALNGEALSRTGAPRQVCLSCMQECGMGETQ
jgi:hypothetical protein